jgi:hypothetical protein
MWLPSGSHFEIANPSGVVRGYALFAFHRAIRFDGGDRPLLAFSPELMA